MATYIHINEQQPSGLLKANRTQTAQNRLALAQREQATAQAEQQQQAAPEPQINPSRRTLVVGDELAAFRRLFKADFFVLKYGFTTGEDLDTRTTLYNPETQQLMGPVGWCKDNVIEVTPGKTIVTWGGDNQGTGVESVLIDLKAYRAEFPASSTIVLRTAAFWYSIKGNGVELSFTGYLGGQMVKQESLFTWTNDTAQRTYTKYPTFPTTAVQTNESKCLDGDFITYLRISINTGRIQYTSSL